MNRMTTFLTIVIIALCGVVVYYVIRINNLKSILEIKGGTSGVLPQTLEGEILALKHWKSAYLDLDSGLSELGARGFLDTEELDVTSVQPFINNFLIDRNPGDLTHTIIFDFPKIIQGIKLVYGVTPTQWDSLAYWNDKALIVYPANYGASGYPTGQNINQTTAILQLAKSRTPTLSDPEKWQALVRNNKVYNFGDLKPPKGAIK